MSTQYQVIEDNGGGLHIFVFDNGEVVRGITNLEHLSHEDFMFNINALNNGDDAADWDGQIENPGDVYEEMTSSEYGWEVIANERETYPERMGRAGQMAFGIDSD